METNNYIVPKSGVNRSKHVQAGEMTWIHKSIKNTISNYTQWSERIIEVKLNMGGRKLSFLDSTPQNKEQLKKNETFCNKLKEILHKTNKNDYILLSGALNDRTGNSEVRKNA